MSTGYYRPEMTPPGYEGKTWPHRLVERNDDGEQTERMVPSPFPPATVGVPAEDLPAFRDFQNWGSRNEKREHPERYCQGCGIRYAVAICTNKNCKSGRTVLADGEPLAEQCRHRCLNCRLEFVGLLLCGPCIGDRQATGQLRAPTSSSASTTPKRSHPMRRPAATSGARR